MPVWVKRMLTDKHPASETQPSGHQVLMQLVHSLETKPPAKAKPRTQRHGIGHEVPIVGFVAACRMWEGDAEGIATEYTIATSLIHKVGDGT